MAPKLHTTLGWIADGDHQARPIGWAWLVERHGLSVVPPHRWTFVSRRGQPQVESRTVGEPSVEILPPSRAPGNRDIDHLLFALRYEGTELGICRALLDSSARAGLARELEQEVNAKPTSAFRRRAWFLFEAITGERLDLGDLDRGNYVPLLDPRRYFTGPAQRIRRQRIELNLLGPIELSPMVRRTEILSQWVDARSSEILGDVVESLVRRNDPSLIRRALSFLSSRETMASFEIEHERPPRDKAERFMAAIRSAPEVARLDEQTLIGLQQRTVEPRYADTGWRSHPIYVGESLDWSREKIHYIAPRAEDLPELMQLYLQLAERLVREPTLDPVVAASVISFTFVLLHPFNDGNGRLHRWLIHWVLGRREAIPEGLVIPVSAVMLARRQEYDEALESFSRPLIQMLSYELDREGWITIHGETTDLYRHPDLTAMTEALARWLELAVTEDLPAELGFLRAYDSARQGLRRRLEMPDRLADLFIKLCRQNGGRLAERKRRRHFAELEDDEIADLEAIVAESFASAKAGPNPGRG